jgi:hypothetical protein
MNSARLRHRAATDPIVPLMLFGGVAVLGAVLGSPWPLWLVLGGVAGYSLSGSV